ncbi:hypothetical protein F3I62_16720 [Pseudomonas sp. R-28-1W-6]|uniref:hypothetical protein n=1 Tax=Pseudomonas sp. R-28-1W-6 TaxID=2650101 RepID=UPI001365AC9E|nr:hypothetical protein [Pseudomonas sp. R-28-1W-6]MWV13745.1 hypothetical protein [Pseudomonas sp. R-28-1W-6]
MARSTMEVAFLGTQRFDGEGGVKYIKVFYGDEPDGKTEHGLSIIGMAADDDAAEEIFAAGAKFSPLELVRITFDVARGGQNKGKNLALHIESVKPKATTQASPQQPNPSAKPAEPAKA